MGKVHAEISDALRAIMEASPLTRTAPPPVIVHMGLVFTEYQPGQSLCAEFPALPCFSNSAGATQGGILCAALDAVFGALAVLESGQPCVTLTLNTVYHRPVPADGAPYAVEVRLTEIADRFVYLQGAVRDQAGNEAVFSNTTMKIMGAPVAAPGEKS